MAGGQCDHEKADDHGGEPDEESHQEEPAPQSKDRENRADQGEEKPSCQDEEPTDDRQHPGNPRSGHAGAETLAAEKDCSLSTVGRGGSGPDRGTARRKVVAPTA